MEVIFLVIILIMSVVIHEVSHGYVADLLGDPTARYAGRLTLNPLKHLDWFGSVILPALMALMGGIIFGWAKPVPYNPYNLKAGRWGPAYVAAAGPASNLVILLLFSLALKFFGVALPPAAVAIMGLIVLINLMLAIFNLIPVPPLDGSKILFALLPPRWRHVETWLLRYQWVLIILLLLVLLNSDALGRIIFSLFNWLV
ncbi:MAG: site-2 protease family protein [Patescibacteria group bacterium]|nr:site-2 protease family protein [Patescibacteria group bacterium]